MANDTDPLASAGEEATNSKLAPEVQDGLPPRKPLVLSATKRRYKANVTRTNLDAWEASELARAITPFVRRVPGPDGTLPDRPDQGVSEFIDPEMTNVTLAEKLAPELPFAVTPANLKGVMTRFFGTPLKPAKKRPQREALTGAAGQEEHEARIAELEKRLGQMMVKVNELEAASRRERGTIKGQQDIIGVLTRKVAKLEADVVRIDEEKVNKVGSPLLEAARRNTRDPKPEPTETTHDLSKLGEIMQRRKRFGPLPGPGKG